MDDNSLSSSNLSTKQQLAFVISDLNLSQADSLEKALKTTSERSGLTSPQVLIIDTTKFGLYILFTPRGKTISFLPSNKLAHTSSLSLLKALLLSVLGKPTLLLQIPTF